MTTRQQRRKMKDLPVEQVISLDDEITKPRALVAKKTNTIVGLLVFLATIFVYIRTQALTLSFWDCGEYITCGSILGIPHAPGNPFYIILGRFFSIIGLGLPHAIIVSWTSVLFSALAVMFIYLITVKLVSMFMEKAWLIIVTGLVAACYTAFSYTFWNNAVEAEVYAGLSLILNLIIWLTLVWVEKSSHDLNKQNYLLLIIYVFFLGFAVHQTVLQIAPAVLFIALYPTLYMAVRKDKTSFWARAGAYFVGLILVYVIFNAIGKSVQFPSLTKWMFAITIMLLLIYHLRGKVSLKTWLLAGAFVLIGFSPHIFILIRSSLRPFINEGYPHNMGLFTDYILRKQYGTTSFLVRRASWFYQFKVHFLDYFAQQFFHAETLSGWLNAPKAIFQTLGNFIVALLGFSGIYYHWKKNRHSFIYFFSFYFMSSIAMIVVSNLSDSEVRPREYFFTNAYYLWTIWMAIASIGLVGELLKKNQKTVAYIVLAIALLLPGINLGSQYFIHDRTGEFIALDYGLNFLNSLEENAIIFTNGDNDTFPLWYAQAVYDPNSIEFVHPARDVYPDDKTRELIAKAMEYKNEQCRGIRKDVTIANLSLLNTGWYIRQLRDKEGVHVSLADNLIEPQKETSPLYPSRLPQDYKVKIPGATPEQSFAITLKKDTVMYSKDWAVLYLIRDNFGKRPMYFAVTIPDESIETVGFGNHRRNEGMVDRIVKIETYDFELKSNAKTVSLMGDFTRWQPEPMEQISQGHWKKSVRMMPGVYGYYFLENGRKTVLDPANELTAMNEMGRENSVIIADFDIDRLITNIDSLYQYRSIFDDSVYKDDNMTRLVNNYAAAYISRASHFYMKMGDMEKAVDFMEKGVAFIEGKPRVKKALYQLYEMAASRFMDEKNYSKAFKILLRQIAADPSKPEPYLQAALILLDRARIAREQGEESQAQVNTEEAFKLVENALAIQSDDDYVLSILMSIAEESKEYDFAIQLMEKVKSNHPDEKIEAYINRLKQSKVRRAKKNGE
ncbi:MAG: DUF2723 domain-containing protein [Candidatus Cloacimonetes bacterium]|nr:DUF2723 domain-containing protein [Candidatus Cloacimonadota bacterium]